MLSIPPRESLLTAKGVLNRSWLKWWNNLRKLLNGVESDKADRVSGATAGNFAALTADGNLEDSGHKDSDYADAVHTHDDRYYTEAEVLAAFAAIAHTHDDRYYTEAEAVALFAAVLHTHAYEPLVTPVAYQATPTAETLRDALVTLGFMEAAPTVEPERVWADGDERVWVDDDGRSMIDD